MGMEADHCCWFCGGWQRQQHECNGHQWQGLLAVLLAAGHMCDARAPAQGAKSPRLM